MEMTDVETCSRVIISITVQGSFLSPPLLTYGSQKWRDEYHFDTTNKDMT